MAVDVLVRQQQRSQHLGLRLGREVVVDAELLDQSVDDVVVVAGFEVEKEST